MPSSYFAEFFGIAAAAAGLYAAYARTIIPLRIAAIAANFLAMIYSLSGNRSSALNSIKAARAGGIQKLWFQGQAFRWLDSDPEFQGLLR